MNISKIANNIIERLKKNNIESYIWHESTTGSIYIRFSDPRMCSIRISDHNGRNHLKYKYNIRSDIRKSGWRKDNGIWRYYLPLNKWEEIIDLLIIRNNEIKNLGPAKYQYNIPSFKTLN